MVDATLSRGNTTVNVPLVQAGSGAVLVGRDVGKPHLAIRPTGAADPYFQDRYSQLETYSLAGRFKKTNAFTNAIDMADLLKNHGQGSAIDLSIPLDEYDDTVKVVPAAQQDQAATFTYEPGRTQQVTVDMNLTRVSSWQGAGSVSDVNNAVSNTPTAAGSGPIQLTDGTRTIDLDKDVTIERVVGRPNSTLQRTTEGAYPIYIDKIKSAYDAFNLEFQITESNASTVRDLNTMLSQKLGGTALTLDFQGKYGMGAFSVVPVGSRAGRDVSPSGYNGVSLVPTLSLRRVQEV